MRLSPKWGWFAAFTAAFAVFAAYVFWGTWSTAVTFISPDNPPAFDLSYSDTLTRWLNDFRTTGRALPSDVLWSGLLFSPHFCRELKYVSAVYCAGLAFAWFLRGRGLSFLASYGAGLLLSFSGYWLTLFSAGHAGWFVWMTYGVFAFGLIDRAVATGAARYWLLLGAAVAWASFNQPDLWFLFTLFTGAYFVWRAVRGASGEGGLSARLKPLSKGCALAAASCALIGAPSFVYALTVQLEGRTKQIEESSGAGKSAAKSEDNSDDKDSRWIFVTNWSLPPSEVTEFFNSGANGDTSCPFTLSINRPRGVRPYVGALGRPFGSKEGNYRQHSLYVGWVTCLFALFGAVSAFFGARRAGGRRADVAFFVAAAVVFCLFSFGRYFEPAYRLVFAMPFGDLMRAPVKWHHLTELCLCALAGYGIEWALGFVREEASAPAFRRFMRPALAVLVLVGAASLAVNARLYCAPVDYGAAIRAKCKPQLAVLSRQQFSEPNVAALVKAGRIISVANWLGNPDAFLVQVLEPAKHVQTKSAKPLPFALGIVSVIAALCVIGYAAKTCRRGA